MKNIMRLCVGALAHTMAAVTSGTWEAMLVMNGYGLDFGRVGQNTTCLQPVTKYTPVTITYAIWK
jgi:multidrug transporter EmrE-like cation transporter